MLQNLSFFIGKGRSCMHFFTSCPNLIWQFIRRLLFENNLTAKLKSEKIIQTEKQLKGSNLCKNLLEHSPNSKNFCLISYCHKSIRGREGTHWIYPKESPFFLPSRMKSGTRPQFSLQKDKKLVAFSYLHLSITWREHLWKALEGLSWKSQCMRLPCADKSYVSLQQVKLKPKYFHSIAMMRSKHIFLRYVGEAKEC